MMIAIFVLATNPIMVNSKTAPIVLELQPVYDKKFEGLENYQVFQVSFSRLIKGISLDQFVSHPQKEYPIAYIYWYSFLYLAFPGDILVTQIQYFGTGLKAADEDLKVEKFNLLIYYRFKNDVLTEWELQAQDLINGYRVEQNLTIQRQSKKVQWVARSKSLDMSVNKYFDHSYPTYGGGTEILKMFGVINGWWTENLGASTGVQSAPGILQSWKGSPGHNKAMLSNRTTMACGAFMMTGVGTRWTHFSMNLDETIDKAFTFGEDLVLLNPYNMTDPIILANNLKIVGLVALSLFAALSVGVVTALVIKKIRIDKKPKEQFQ